MAGTIVVDRIESDASYASTINVANRITFSNTVNFGVTSGAPVAGFYSPSANTLVFTTASTEKMRIDSSGVVSLSNTVTGTPRFEVMSIVDNNNQGFRLQGSGDTVYQHISASSNTLNFQQYYSAAWRTAAQISGNAAADFKFNSGFGSAATAYGCRAWVNFNGTTNTAGFCTIRASGGVTSVADNGTGDYTINFSFTMPDANYAVVGTAKIVGGAGGQSIRIHNDAYTTSVTTSAVKVQVTNSGNSAMADSEMVNIAVFR
jgi:hypothetical protein